MKPLGIALVAAAMALTSGTVLASGASIQDVEAYRASLAHWRSFVADPAMLASAQLTNTGDVKTIDFTGHDLTDLTAVDGGATTILYAPSEADDATYRAAISAAAGGAIVDYFDARVATPDVALLSSYDGATTWANFAYSNNVLFGDNLASANRVGCDVVLGTFCTYTSGNFLSGRIMTARFCPVVSPLGNNHFVSSNYSGNGVTCLYTGVTALASVYRDFLVTQGSGTVDGTFLDAEICGAYRVGGVLGQAGACIYSNGSGAFQLGGTGQWGAHVANGCTCGVGLL